MGKISLQELASVLAERGKMTKRDASAFVSTMFEIVQQHLEADKLVKVKGLGTFKIIDVEDRESVNVNTGERVLIEGHGKITFTPDAVMKELVNKPFAQFETVVLNEGVDFDDVTTTTTDAPEPEVDVEPEPVSEPEPVVAAEPVSEPEPVVEDDHAQVPLVDFGGSAESADFDDDINDEREDELEPKAEAKVANEPKVLQEVADEDIPEWVIEPMKEPVVEPEPEPEPIVEPEPEPVAEPEPAPEVAPEPAPEVESEPEAAPEPEVMPEPEVEVEEQPAVEEEPAVEEAEEEPARRSRKVGGSLMLSLLTLVLGLAIGYLFGNYYPYKNLLPVESSETVIHVQKEEPKAEPKAEPVTEMKQEVEAEPQAEPVAPAKPEPKAEPVVQEKPKAEAKAEPKTQSVSDKYGAMDVRVRLGAYRIVGTEKVVKVKEGEDLVKISRRVLGPGMECYLEVFNNIKASTPLKVGQEIKIPKLEVKKKKKADTAK